LNSFINQLEVIIIITSEDGNIKDDDSEKRPIQLPRKICPLRCFREILKGVCAWERDREIERERERERERGEEREREKERKS